MTTQHTGEPDARTRCSPSPVSALCFMFVWTIFLCSYLVSRRTRKDKVTASTFRLLFVAWMFVRRSPNHLARHAAHIAHLRDDSVEAD